MIPKTRISFDIILFP